MSATAGSDVDKHLELGKQSLADGQLLDALHHYSKAIGKSKKNGKKSRMRSWKICSRGWFRSTDLWVMGPTRSRCATLLSNRFQKYAFYTSSLSLPRWRPYKLFVLFQESSCVFSHGESQISTSRPQQCSWVAKWLPHGKPHESVVTLLKLCMVP